MATALRGKGSGRQRQLIFGGGGAGKTHLAMSQAAAAMGPSDVLYVVDSDNAVGVMLEAGVLAGKLSLAQEWSFSGKTWVCDWAAEEDENGFAGNVVIYHWRDWEGFAAALWQVEAAVGRDDWVLIDSITKPWTSVQGWLIRRTHGEDMDEWLIDYKVKQMSADKGGDKNSALVEDGSWPIINTLWDKVVQSSWLENPPCHVIATAEAKAIRSTAGDKGRDSESIRTMYGDVGEKPDTQKSVGFKMRTVIHMQKQKVGRGRILTVVKHWGLEEPPEGVVIGSAEGMASGERVLLRQMQGWKPTRVGE